MTQIIIRNSRGDNESQMPMVYPDEEKQYAVG